MTPLIVRNFSSYSTYYFNVLVKDERENKSSYTMKSQKTTLVGNVKVAESVLESSNMSFPSAIPLSNGNMMVVFSKNISSNTTGRFLILSSAGTIVKSTTQFGGSNSDHISAARLSSGNVVMAYQDVDDSKKGKFVIYDQNGSEVKSAVTFKNGTTSSTSVAMLTNGNFMIAYQDEDDSNNGKFVIFDANGNSVKTETQFAADIVNGGVKITSFSNGNVFISYGITYQQNFSQTYYVIYDVNGNALSSATTIISSGNRPLQYGSNVMLFNRGGTTVGFLSYSIYDSSGNTLKEANNIASTSGSWGEALLPDGQIFLILGIGAGSGLTFTVYNTINATEFAAVPIASSSGNNGVYLSKTAVFQMEMS